MDTFIREATDEQVKRKRWRRPKTYSYTI